MGYVLVYDSLLFSPLEQISQLVSSSHLIRIGWESLGELILRLLDRVERG